MDMPAVGTRVKRREREGFVSSVSLGTVKRVGDKLQSAGAWVEVTLNDGKGPANVIRLHEEEWGDLEILST